ncbi:MAG: transcriptional regulator [Clostridia bacterium]|nr:transcriptional regulator [Clostridia bacterium]
MTLTEAIQKRIYDLAIKYDLSVYGLAKKCGVSRSTLCMLAEYKSIGVIIIYNICEGLGITLKEFFDSPLFARENLSD